MRRLWPRWAPVGGDASTCCSGETKRVATDFSGQGPRTLRWQGLWGIGKLCSVLFFCFVCMCRSSFEELRHFLQVSAIGGALSQAPGQKRGRFRRGEAERAGFACPGALASSCTRLEGPSANTASLIEATWYHRYYSDSHIILFACSGDVFHALDG